MQNTDEFVVLDMAPEEADAQDGAAESKRARRKRQREEKKAEKRAIKDMRKIVKKQKRSHKRRLKLFMPILVLLIVLATAAGCAVNIFYCRTHFDVNFYQVESAHIVRDLRVIVISDLHLREYGAQNKELVDTVKSLHPDLILSAGDLVTYGNPQYDNMLDFCTALAKIAPLYGVMGNHEDEKVYLEGDKQLRDRFAKTGMHLLINSAETVDVGGSAVELVGISGGVSSFDRYGGRKAMDALDEKGSAFRICVCHVPAVFRDRLAEYRFDLGVAGHTHGGLIRLPVIGGLFSAEDGLLPEFDGGLYTLDNAATLFVSRGLGDSADIPPRLNNTPELAVIDVRWY